MSQKVESPSSGPLPQVPGEFQTPSNFSPVRRFAEGFHKHKREVIVVFGILGAAAAAAAPFLTPLVH